MTENSTIKAAPPNSAAHPALFFRRLRHTDFSIFLQETFEICICIRRKSIRRLATAFARRCLNDLTKGSAAMKRIISVLLVLMFLFPASALADLRRGDRGEEVRQLQQMLWDTGFIFEEPDGVFGGNTEKAVKWFQEYALLKQTGVVDDRTIDSLYACWLQIMEENGYAVPDDEMEPQTAAFVSEYNSYGDDDYGDYPAYCHRYTTDAGNEHVEMCSFHPSWPQISRCRGWKSGRTSSTISTRSGSTSPWRRSAPPWPPLRRSSRSGWSSSGSRWSSRGSRTWTITSRRCCAISASFCAAGCTRLGRNDFEQKKDEP